MDIVQTEPDSWGYFWDAAQGSEVLEMADVMLSKTNVLLFNFVTLEFYLIKPTSVKLTFCGEISLDHPMFCWR